MFILELFSVAAARVGNSLPKIFHLCTCRGCLPAVPFQNSSVLRNLVDYLTLCDYTVSAQ